MLEVLVMCAGYLPGVKYGGPIQSISNIVARTKTRVSYKIVAADRDLGDVRRYPNILSKAWNDVGGASVYYASPRELNPFSLARVLNSVSYDILFLNSQFCPGFTILPLLLRRLRMVKPVPTLLAPRGECAPAALNLKRAKKRVYLTCARGLGLYSKVSFLATAEHEARDIRRLWGEKVQILVLPEVSQPAADKRLSVEKRRGTLKLITLGRVSEIKNIFWGLEMLKKWSLKMDSGQIELNIYGPIEDQEYWKRCKGEIQRMSPFVTVEYKGILDHAVKFDVLRQHHCLFSTTHGENFGHAIAEALSVGLPVLTTERTPWKGLQDEGAGWALPLDERTFCSVLELLLSMDQSTFDKLSSNALLYAHQRDRESGANRFVELFATLHTTVHS